MEADWFAVASLSDESSRQRISGNPLARRQAPVTAFTIHHYIIVVCHTRDYTATIGRLLIRSLASVHPISGPRTCASAVSLLTTLAGEGTA